MLLVAFLLIFSSILSENILIKFPTRERPERFFNQLDLYQGLLSGKNHTQFLVSIDADDTSMNNPQVIANLKQYPNTTFYIGQRTTKMGAINRDVEKHLNFDILLLASDDMTPIQQDYDQVIVNTFKKHFPNLDGTLHFNDGHVGKVLNTFPIMGKKYYNRFGYIYHPDYISIECDREYTLVSKLLNKVVYLEQVLFRHDHPLYGNTKDALFLINETPKKHRHDRQVYQKRMKSNFDLDKQTDYISSSLDKQPIKKREQTKVDLSILIPTLNSREAQFKNLYANLESQITKWNLQDKVEVVYFKDNKHHTVGHKRNKLMEKSCGQYVCFLDDDDDIHADYIKILFDALQSKPDCVGITGIITDKGQNPTEFVQSLQNKTHSKKNGQYLWPIRHLNPVKKELATKFKFTNKNNGEDTDWHIKLNRSGLLKTEVFIDKPIYFYNYDLDKSETRSSN